MRLAGIVLLFLAFQADAQDTAYVRNWVNRLCEPNLHGRGYFKDGTNAAAYEIQEELRKIGLQFWDFDPYQEFSFQVNTFPGAMHFVIDGAVLTPGRDYLVNDDSPSINGNFNLVHRDSLPEVVDGRYIGPAFEAKTALVLNAKWFNKTQARGGVLVSSLKQAGVAAVVLPSADKLTWSVGREQAPMPVVTVVETKWPSEAKEIKLIIEAKLEKKFRALNVMGYIEGTHQPKEFVVFSAHYDHLGRMGNEAIFPGANDNASGTAMLLDLARHYMKDENKPRRSVAFMFFAAEEAGLLGSMLYVKKPLFALQNIRFLINLDLLGTGEEGITVVNGAVHEREFELITELNAEQQLLPAVKKRGKAANSDHYPFSEAGVPAFFIYAMGPRKAYHDVDDVPATLTLAGYNPIFQLITSFLAQLP